MGYFRHFIALLMTCGIQYACSFGLITLGYYSNWIYPMGGFIIWIIVFLIVRNVFFWNEKKLSLAEQNEISSSLKVIAFFVIIATFWVNYKLIEIHDNYEYSNYGITVKALVAKKSTSKAGKGGTLYHIVFSSTQNKQEITRKYSPEKEEYEKLRVGDSLKIMYSTRNTYFTAKFTKIIP